MAGYKWTKAQRKAQSIRMENIQHAKRRVVTNEVLDPLTPAQQLSKILNTLRNQTIDECAQACLRTLNQLRREV